jgi:aspartate/tyrosine/aromatic aminotransferase
MVDNARINVAGLVGEKVDCVAEAILLTKDHVSK